MEDSVLKSLLSQDISAWRQSVVSYIKDARPTCLDLQTILWEDLNLQDPDLQPIIDALAGSDVTEFHLGGAALLKNVQNLITILSKTKIEKLNLMSFGLPAEGFIHLMTILKDTQISELNVYSNNIRLRESHQIEGFMTHLVKSNLKSLNLSCNNILPDDKIPAFFEKLQDTQITHLDFTAVFARNDFFQKKHIEFCSVLTSSMQYTSITDLNLRSNGLGDDVAKALGDVLGKSKLQKLNLCDNKLTDCGVDFLVPGLINSKITDLNLSKNMINGDNTLGDCLKNTKIRKLDLSRNPITNARIFSSPNFLQGSELRTLKLYSCLKSNETIFAAIRSLKFSKLTCLDLSCNSLGLEHVCALADVLSESNLTHISLHQNKFCDESLNILGDCLVKSKVKYVNLCSAALFNLRGVASLLEKTKNSEIVFLNLKDNELSEQYGILASALTNTKLLSLDFAFNHSWLSVKSITEQLKSTAMTELNLSGGDIGDVEAIALAKCLEDSQIVILSLSDNCIQNSGAEALALGLKKTKLRQLDLKNNEIENYGLERLAEHAENSCVTYINVQNNPGTRKLLLDRVMWENRKRIQLFADLLKRTAIFTGDSNIFEFDRNFDGIDIDVFIEDCLELYMFVTKEPFIVNLIEQDKCISDLNDLKSSDFDDYCCKHIDAIENKAKQLEVFIEDSSIIYNNVLEQSGFQITAKTVKNFNCNERVLWLMSEEFPRKFVSFIGKAVDAHVEEHVELLKKIEKLGLKAIVELLLLNRPMYVIDEKQDILHPQVYILLHKYKQPICNLEIEPKGVRKIVEYFRNHIDLDGASEVLFLLRDSAR